MKNIRWKVFTIVGVFAVFFALGVYPILATRYGLPAPAWLKARQLDLGLDLQGGVHLVLRVHTDEALKTSTTTTAEQLREAARVAGITVSALSVPSPTTFRIEGVPHAPRPHHGGARDPSVRPERQPVVVHRSSAHP